MSDNEPYPKDRPAHDVVECRRLLELAWGIIANAAGGDWERELPEWQEAAARWRDRYHVTLPDPEPTPRPPPSPPGTAWPGPRTRRSTWPASSSRTGSWLASAGTSSCVHDGSA